MKRSLFKEDPPSGVEILIFLCGAVFLWEIYLGVRMDLRASDVIAGTLRNGPHLEEWLFGIGAILAHPILGILDPRSLATALFVHFGLLHILFNMYALHSLGREIERLEGPRGLFLGFLLTGLSANLISVGWHTWLWRGPLIQGGASGALTGLIGILYQRAGRYLAGGMIRQQILRWMIAIVVFSFAVRGDNAAHIGGFVAGMGVERVLIWMRPRPRLAWGIILLFSAVVVSSWAMAVRLAFS